MFGLTFNYFSSAIDTLYALPLNDVTSVKDDAPVRTRSSKLTSVSANGKYPGHTIKAFYSLVGYAGFKISTAMTSVYFSTQAIRRMEKKADTGDRIINTQLAITERIAEAEQWLALREYLIPKLESQITAENVECLIHPVTPFPISESDVKSYLKEIDESSLFNEMIESKTNDREEIISLINNLNPTTGWSDAISFESISKLVLKLDTLADEEREKKKLYAFSNEKVAKACNIKKLAIETVADELNRIVENDSYELIIDNSNVCH